MRWRRRTLLASLLAAPGFVLGSWRARGAPIVPGVAPPAEGEPLAALGAWLRPTGILAGARFLRAAAARGLSRP